MVIETQSQRIKKKSKTLNNWPPSVCVNEEREWVCAQGNVAQDD